MITTAKGITSAYAPLGAVIAADRVAEPFLHGTEIFNHGFTFGGHPVACATALANIDVLEREDLCGRVLANEARFREMLEGLRDLPIVGDVRGAGYFHAIELVKDKETKATFDHEEAEQLLRGFLSGELYRRGLICRTDDRGDPIVQLSPPLIAGEEQFAGNRVDPAPRAERGLGMDLRWSSEARWSASRRRERASRSEDASGEADDGAHGREPDRRAGPGALQRARLRRGARALGAHHRAGRSHAVAEGRRAAAHHRHPARGPEGQHELIERLAEHEIAGLGFGTGFAHKKVPVALVNAARKLDFPVFEVPYELPFIAITERVFAQLVDERYELLQRSMAGDVLAEALTGNLYPEELQAKLHPFGIGEQAAVLAFSLSDPALGAPLLERMLERAGVHSLVAIRAGLLCAVIDVDGVEPDPIELAGRARTELQARLGEVRAAASRPAATHSLRLSFHEARCALEAARLRNGDAQQTRSPPTRISAPSSCCYRYRTTTR